MFDILSKFLDKVKKDRHELMVRKGFIENDVEYTDALWESFRNKWLSKPAI